MNNAPLPVENRVSPQNSKVTLCVEKESWKFEV